MKRLAWPVMLAGLCLLVWPSESFADRMRCKSTNYKYNFCRAGQPIARAWVPMDDHHSMLFDISGGVDEGNPAYVSKRRNGQPLYEKFEYEPNTNDWHGRWRCRDRAHNDWGLDRQSQRDGTQYTGIGNITIQDQAVTESMGPITDHDWEHLAPTDQMIARTRRRLLLAARAYRDSGELPPGASDPDTFMGARAGSFLFAPDAPLEQAYQAQLEKAVRWTAQPEERA